MRQIGGDFLLARWDTSQGEDKPRLNLVLLDVTGHGISSALTVNRLAGELERLYAEDPDASPSKVLCALNKYVYLTLANHALYCTAMCIRLDPYEHATSSSQSTRAHADENAPNAARSGILRVASGGHPPAFLRTPAASRDESQQNAAVRVIESTAPMLGVLGPEDFSVDETVLTIREGETLIALTDGAVETRNDAGALFSERRVLQFLQRSQTPVGGWCQGLLSEVDAFRVGAPSDDTVVVEVSIDASTTKPT
jgi:serine phosphatase RsbU (regulator of sigma subunit)